MTEKKKPPTPAEAIDALRNHLPIVTDILISNVQDDARGQTATISFNEPDHPLLPLLVDELGDRQPSKQFTILLIELDDNGVAVDQVRRAKVRKLMNKQGRATKHFFALIRDIDFQRWLYSVHGLEAIAGCDTPTERNEVARAWAEENVGHEDLDVDQEAFDRFHHIMREPFYEWRHRYRAHQEAQARTVHRDREPADRATSRSRRERPRPPPDLEREVAQDERLPPDPTPARDPHRSHEPGGDRRRVLGAHD